MKERFSRRRNVLKTVKPHFLKDYNHYYGLYLFFLGVLSSKKSELVICGNLAEEAVLCIKSALARVCE